MIAGMYCIVLLCGCSESLTVNTMCRRYLAEGILPTTNEISVLKFLEDGEEEFTQNSDGFFIRRLPAKLLQEMNVVDTPGTNVILDRQQRLTEEYVPRADLVLFVMSADRPFTESEVNFLKYIRQWGKKVIFLVNKASSPPRPPSVFKFPPPFPSKPRLVFGTPPCKNLLSPHNLPAPLETPPSLHLHSPEPFKS